MPKKKEFCIKGHKLSETRRVMHDGYERCYECVKERQKRYYLTLSDKRVKNQWLSYRYGLSLDDWTHIFEEQGCKCAICGTHETKQWHTDHCHTTNKVRGILCAACNRNLGGYEIMLKYLDAVKDYLK